MTSNRILCLLFFSSLVQALSAQTVRHTVSGTVRDAGSGEELIGAAIFVPGLDNTGAVTNEYGFYSLTLPEGRYTLTASYVGFAPFEKAVQLDKDISLDIRLSEGALLTEVTVRAERSDDNLTRTDMGVEKLNVREISRLPVLFGERDILKTIQLLPGIKVIDSTNEPANANNTVKAIGRKSFPSVPCNAKIGR